MPGFEPQQGEDTGIRDALAMRQMGATVSPKDIDKALKPYKLQDAKVKGKTDTELYNMAQTGVVKWWQRQQKAKIVDRDPGKTNTVQENRALSRMNSRVENALGEIPQLNLKAQARAEAAADHARQQQRAILQEYGAGFLRHVEPPAYAMTNVSQLRAWVRRQIYRRNQQREAREAYLR